MAKFTFEMCSIKKMLMYLENKSIVSFFMQATTIDPIEPVPSKPGFNPADYTGPTPTQVNEM